MREPGMKRWILGGSLFWAALLVLTHFCGVHQTIRKDARYSCLCPDSTLESGPRSLHNGRN
jgi:hypothetical protein